MAPMIKFMAHKKRIQEKLPLGRGLGTILWYNGRRQRGLVLTDDGGRGVAPNGEFGWVGQTKHLEVVATNH